MPEKTEAMTEAKQILSGEVGRECEIGARKGCSPNA